MKRHPRCTSRSGHASNLQSKTTVNEYEMNTTGKFASDCRNHSTIMGTPQLRQIWTGLAGAALISRQSSVNRWRSVNLYTPARYLYFAVATAVAVGAADIVVCAPACAVCTKRHPTT